MPIGKRHLANTLAGLARTPNFGVLCREVVRDSQMTVPETPSPDFVARRARRPLAAFQPSALGAKTGSNQVCAWAPIMQGQPALH